MIRNSCEKLRTISSLDRQNNRNWAIGAQEAREVRIATTKLTKKGVPDLRHARREDRLGKLESLLRKPRSIEELAGELGVTARAIYFLFDALTARGRTVARLGSKASGTYILIVV